MSSAAAGCCSSSGVAELHVYDFDGTIFRSPVPHPQNEVGCPGFLEFVRRPRFYGGLGWFQSEQTLNPPNVPLHPPLSWYVESTVTAIRESLRRAGVLVVVLTGREQPFRRRIEQLLDDANITPHMLLLKPPGRMGTTRFKLGFLERAIYHYRPNKILLFEDRPEQMEKLAVGLMDIARRMEEDGTSVARRQSEANGGEVAQCQADDGGQQQRELYAGFKFRFVLVHDGNDNYFSAERENSLFWSLHAQMEDEYYYGGYYDGGYW